jgi:hypothetical protein
MRIPSILLEIKAKARAPATKSNVVTSFQLVGRAVGQAGSSSLRLSRHGEFGDSSGGSGGLKVEAAGNSVEVEALAGEVVAGDVVQNSFVRPASAETYDNVNPLKAGFRASGEPAFSRNAISLKKYERIE